MGRTIRKDIISDSQVSQFENSVPLKPVLGPWATSHNYITTHEQNRVCYFRFSGMFLASRGTSFRTYFILTEASVVPSLNVSPYIFIVEIIYFLSFGIIGLIRSYFQKRLPLKPVLGAWALELTQYNRVCYLRLFVFFASYRTYSYRSSYRTYFVCCITYTCALR